jgi:hypothetical protein
MRLFPHPDKVFFEARSCQTSSPGKAWSVGGADRRIGAIEALERAVVRGSLGFV